MCSSNELFIRPSKIWKALYTLLSGCPQYALASFCLLASPTDGGHFPASFNVHFVCSVHLLWFDMRKTRERMNNVKRCYDCIISKLTRGDFSCCPLFELPLIFFYGESLRLPDFPAKQDSITCRNSFGLCSRCRMDVPHLIPRVSHSRDVQAVIIAHTLR